MSDGTFLMSVCAAFILIVFATPVISFSRLRRERDRLAEFQGRKRLAAIFFTEILLWVAVSLVFGFVLLTMMWVAVFATGEAVVAQGIHDEPRASLLSALLFAVPILGLALVGLLIHNLTMSELLKGTSDPEHPLSLSRRQK
jgi:heme/copper-type cytochrome/quinol oxidase subunit 2